MILRVDCGALLFAQCDCNVLAISITNFVRSRYSLLLIFDENTSYKRSMNLHGSERAEFLTTEAFYAFASVNYGLAVHHSDSLCGTDPTTLLASSALTGKNCRFGFKTPFSYLAE